MAFSINRIALIGHLTEKPELRQTPSGVSVCDLNLQVKTKITKEDGSEQTLPSFHTVVLWNKQAEVADQFLHAGSQVYVSGRLKTEEWEAEDKQKRRKTKVISEDLVLLDSKNEISGAIEGLSIAEGVNRAEVLGNLTRDPELRQTPNGTSVCSFGVATNRRWKGKDSEEMQEETEFHNVVVWEKLAKEVGENIKKGQKVYISGRCITRSWETPEGEKRRTTEIVAETVLLLGHTDTALAQGQGARKSDEESAPKGKAKKTAKVEEGELPEIPEIKHESDIKPEDLPF